MNAILNAMINLSPDQEKTIQILYKWFTSPRRTPYITVGGYAGTGKTTIVSIFRNKLFEDKKYKNIKVAFVSYTGKAANVLKNTIKQEKATHKGDTIGTIHSLIYEPVVDERTKEIISWKKKEDVDADLIIVDEASMVDQNIWHDLLSYSIPIIAVGDHGQLPPINGKFNLMDNPMIKLEQIHRQAKDNPIIQLSSIARLFGEIPIKKYGSKVEKLDKKSYEAQEKVQEMLESFTPEMLIICGYNFTRIRLNQTIRRYLGFESELPETGDRVICLRNNHKAQIFNGMLGTIRSIEDSDKEHYYAEIEFDDEHRFNGLILKEQFNKPSALNFSDRRKKTLDSDLFDFGYALTTHKAQGSQAKKVLVFEERFKQMDDNMWKRWLYTAVTRAQEELTIVG